MSRFIDSFDRVVIPSRSSFRFLKPIFFKNRNELSEQFNSKREKFLIISVSRHSVEFHGRISRSSVEIEVKLTWRVNR